MKTTTSGFRVVVLGGSVAFCSLAARVAEAHCDTLDGPVVAAAKTALEKGEVTPVLAWVKARYEAELREAYQKAMAVRRQGADAQELADRYFFETAVRLHRAGEGEPYTGLKPAGIDPGPVVRGADQAVETETVDALVNRVTDAVAKGIRQRFALALHKKRHAHDSVDAGRQFVATYVEFVHHTDRLYRDASGAGHDHGLAEEERHETAHENHLRSE